MKKAVRKLMVIVAMMCLCGSPGASAKGWEVVKTEKARTQHVASDSDIEIKVGGGIIYITSSRNINVKIFTILGSRIADDNLAPGAYQFSVPTHGVYIIKAGVLTCKVAV